MTNGSDANASLAMLIDAENANPSIVEGLLAEVAKLGVASVKRIYGAFNMIRSAIEASSDDAGWACLSPVGSYISKTSNDFDPRSYGFDKLSGLIEAIGLFDLDRRENIIYVRDNRKKAK